MVKELLNKYNLDEKYASYLEKFSDDLYLMDINAYVLSRIDKTIEIHFLDGNRNIGSYGVSAGFDLNNSIFLDSRRSGIKNILIDELLNTITLITKENILGVNKLVSNIGAYELNSSNEHSDLSIDELVRFEDMDMSSKESYGAFLRSEITNDLKLIINE